MKPISHPLSDAQRKVVRYYLLSHVLFQRNWRINRRKLDPFCHLSRFGPGSSRQETRYAEQDHDNIQSFTNVCSGTMESTVVAEDSVTSPVKAKKEWLQNAFKKKDHQGVLVTSPAASSTGTVGSLVQDRHRWIEQESQLRKNLTSQGKSDLVISQELVEARKAWLDEQGQKYKDTVVLSPFPSATHNKRYSSHEEKKEERAHYSCTSPSQQNIQEVISQDVVEARRKWLQEQAFGSSNIVGGDRLHPTVSMETNVGLKVVEREDSLKALVFSPVSPIGDAFSQAAAENGPTNKAEFSKEDMPEPVKELMEETKLSKERVHDEKADEIIWYVNAPVDSRDDTSGSNKDGSKPAVIGDALPYIDFLQPTFTEGDGDKESTERQLEITSTVRVPDSDTPPPPPPALSVVPSDERIMDQLKDIDTGSDDFPWRILPDDSSLNHVTDARCLETCSIL